MYRVLLPVDEREPRARAQVNALLDLPAPSDDITVDVLYVHEEVTGPDAEWAAGGFSETYAEEMAENAERFTRLPETIGLVSEQLESAALAHTVHETSGDPAEAILDAATEFESDAIVLGVRDRSPVGKVLFGSVVQAVILESDRPVITVPPVST